MTTAPSSDTVGDRQLGESLAAVLARHAASTPKQRQAILLDLMGDNKSLWPALRHLIEQPGFETLLRDPSPATRLAGKDALLQELATWCNQQMLNRATEFLEGVLGTPGPRSEGQGLAGMNATRQAPDGASKDRQAPHEAPSPSPADRRRRMGAPASGGHKGSADARHDDAEARRLSQLGSEASNHGEHQRAIELLTQALQRDGSNVATYMQRASVYAIVGNLGAAIEDFNAVLRLQPSNLEALTQRGRAKAALGQIVEARQDWQEASNQGHKGARALLEKHGRAGRHQGETTSNTKGPDISPEGQATMLRTQGLAARDQGDHHQALALFTRALRLDSSHAETYMLRGSLLARAGELARALEDFSAVLRLDPGNAEALTQRGKLYEGLGQIDRARLDWEEASRKRQPQACAWLANDYFRRARSEAIRNNHQHAINLITRSIELREPGPEDYLLRGKSHQALKAFQDALIDFSKVLAIQPDHSEALLQRDHVLIALNRAEEARRNWQRATTPGHPQASQPTPSAAKHDGCGWQLLLGMLIIALIGVGIHQKWPASAYAGLASGAGYLFRRSSKG